MSDLWHYTCSHLAPLIIEDGRIIPPAINPRRVNPVIVPAQGAVVWATDLRHPIPHALGLANLSGRVRCDRTEHRFRILDADAFMRWVKVPRDLRREFGPLEETPGARPAHWYIADRSIRVEHDPLPGSPALAPTAGAHA